ncbi:NNP family nitrate/nitrite transporter-like MFS transporter [Mumia flava]|uniref:NNP family nitrate/nitrite transporter-like MFS transporter n=1 Tax=Mumia flava TaxID=1348852 RepID=A0A0B2BLN7_9ACTN|nr:MFS transporter [Mumia flava]PJJ56245.1 NNP family nitrate/nitrite transporter-like MFS transporter [Mumia flava]
MALSTAGTEPGTTTTTSARRRRTGRWIDQWDPEDSEFWESEGRPIARRNLIISIVVEHLGFTVWMLWSIVAVNLNNAGFSLTNSQLLWLVAMPSLVGAALRLPYTFAVGLFGGRNWTIVSGLLLLIPSVGLAWAVANPQIPFWMLLAIASTAGFGGGNFASSMTNISYFYPDREKGWALGLNAAGGNIGVAVVQAPFVVTAVITAGGGLVLWRAGLMWVPLILIAAFLAWKMMDNLGTAEADFATSAAAAKRKHTWVMSFLYIGTFGSFMGYAAAFPMLIKMEFPDVNPASYAFLGALVGSLARPFGGKWADRVGGARVTALSFVVMGGGVGFAVLALRAESFVFFLASFLLLFVATGVSNGSTYRMIPSIFRVTAGEGDEAQLRSKREAAAAIGIISALGAFGGFFVPRIYSMAADRAGTIEPAMLIYIGVYAVMLAVTWFFYLRPGAEMTKARV